VVPALAVGVPDPAMAATALPGHKLVLEGRGREALRLSAVGSGLAVAFAVPLALPITWVMVQVAPTLYAHLPLVVAGVLLALLLTESSHKNRLAGLFVFALGTGLGTLVLPLSVDAPLGGSVLAPLFGGLFGAPVMLDAMDGAGVPPQADTRLAIAPRSLGGAAAAGTVSGAAVGYLPGVSAAVAAVVSLPLVPSEDGARSFLVAASGANTSNAVFALFALVALGSPRTGVLVAVDDVGVPLSLTALLPAVVVAGAVGFVLVTLLGDVALRVVGAADATRLSLLVLGVVTLLSFLFAGPVGLAVLAVATLVGLVPPRLGTRRVYLMGVLLGPLAMASLGS
jgi:putative membrane protein